MQEAASIEVFRKIVYILSMQETADFFNDSAVMLAAEGCHSEAIACLRRGLQLEPFSSLMWFNLGLSYYALDDKDNSRYALYEAARCNPFDADIWDTLGVVLHETGEMEASRLAYTKALALETENGRIWNNYGTLLFNEEKYEQARRAFESALTLAPDSEDTLFNLRDTYTMLGNKKLAKKCTKIIDRLALKNPDTLVQKRNEP